MTKYDEYSPITGSGDFRHVTHVHVSGKPVVNATEKAERVLTEAQWRELRK